MIIFVGRTALEEGSSMALTPQADRSVDELAASVGDPWGGGRIQGLEDLGKGLVQEGAMNGSAGFAIGYGEGIAKLSRRITAVILDETHLEIAGRHGGVWELGNEKDSAMEEADRLGSRGSADVHALFGRVQEAVDGVGADVFKFVGGCIGHAVVFSQPDEVKVQPEEGSENLPAGPVEVFPQHFEHSGGVSWQTRFFRLFSTISTVTAWPSSV
ncbi:hypothetical protein Holit_02584 [Hollandina sp. SP2]